MATMLRSFFVIIEALWFGHQKDHILLLSYQVCSHDPHQWDNMCTFVMTCIYNRTSSDGWHIGYYLTCVPTHQELNIQVLCVRYLWTIYIGMECIGVAWSVFFGLHSSRCFSECHSWECWVLVFLKNYLHYCPMLGVLASAVSTINQVLSPSPTIPSRWLFYFKSIIPLLFNSFHLFRLMKFVPTILERWSYHLRERGLDELELRSKGRHSNLLLILMLGEIITILMDTDTAILGQHARG